MPLQFAIHLKQSKKTIRIFLVMDMFVVCLNNVAR